MPKFIVTNTSETKAKRDFIRINPYEIPELALQVITNICQKNNTADASVIIGSLQNELKKTDRNGVNFYEFINNSRGALYEVDFLFKLRGLLRDLVTELLAHENTNDTQVVVAGGFSAGKSSFLNNLTKAGNLLPTGLKPVSMVSTYLYCSSKTKDLVVKGINLKDAVVLLDKDILQSIQHESKSKVYLASVLNKLFVDMPSDELDGFVFIDTPGYNNSDKKNDTNNKTDRETALEAVGSGNVLLWIVDAGAGTIPAKDLEVIDGFLMNGENRRVAVIFNKADKKGEAEITKIVNEALQSLRRYGNAVIDVLGYSSHEGRIYYSANSYDMPHLLAELKNSGNGNSGVERIRQDIFKLFDDEIEFANSAANEAEKEKRELIDEKNHLYKHLQDEKDGSKAYVESIKEIMIDNYDDILSKFNNLADLTGEILDEWGTSLEKIQTTNLSNFKTKDNIAALANRYLHIQNKMFDKAQEAVKYSYWDSETRSGWVQKIKDQLDRVDQNIASKYEEIEEDINKLNKEINKHREIARRMKEYLDVVRGTLYTCINSFRMSAHKVQDARVDFGQTTDIFTAIRSGNFSKFVNCLANGVKMSESNPEGYTPATYAVKHGAYDMVSFMMQNGVDMRLPDNRGYNAFLTAVQSGHTHIIDLLMKDDPSLVNTVSSKGETVKDIAEKVSLTDVLHNLI